MLSAPISRPLPPTITRQYHIKDNNNDERIYTHSLLYLLGHPRSISRRHTTPSRSLLHCHQSPQDSLPPDYSPSNSPNHPQYLANIPTAPRPLLHCLERYPPHRAQTPLPPTWTSSPSSPPHTSKTALHFAPSSCPPHCGITSSTPHPQIHASTLRLAACCVVY